MATTDSLRDVRSLEPISDTIERGIPSAFEKLITDQPPVLQSLIAQLPTQSILALFHTSFYLNSFFKSSPTSWRHLSWRLYQPALSTATPTNNASGTGPRQSSNYALDQLLLYVINPFSTRLISLELDNTAVSGATLFQTVMILRKDTLEHLSVRGCKNVSLKYHINPWLSMHAMAMERPPDTRATGYGSLALRSLYTYRSRHHRRRPYLPSSLARKESDSEPTHELVLTCRKLGIWTDTSWCTTPGSRCYRRRGYLTTRHTPDQREVWVVYDRLWRSRNWLGPVPVPETRSQAAPTERGRSRKRKQDGRCWEHDEDAMNGESLAAHGDGKTVPSHLRQSYRQFVDDISCDNCSDHILERCEQCSVMMHCVGCRKTLCASCAFDRPYLRNKTAPAEERSKYWWAPGYAVSPCSMLDQDLLPSNGSGSVPYSTAQPPSISFRWCCMEPIFSGGGGITFGSGTSRDMDRMRAAPLPPGHGWEDDEFSQPPECSPDIGPASLIEEFGAPLTRSNAVHGLGNRWSSIDSLFQQDLATDTTQSPPNVPRNLCDECYQTDQWRIKCKACAVPVCLKHDVGDRLRARICGYKDLATEKAEFRSRQKALKSLTALMLKRRQKQLKASECDDSLVHKSDSTGDLMSRITRIFGHVVQEGDANETQASAPTRNLRLPDIMDSVELNLIRMNLGTPISDAETSNRPMSPESNSTGPSSRSSSPTPSAHSLSDSLEQSRLSRKLNHTDRGRPVWRGCESFFCPPSRVPGDQRRRCLASIRQCAECKVHVCEQCVAGLEHPCPCTGCRVSTADNQHAGHSDASLRFFCPNCRWSRMSNGKCKRKLKLGNGIDKSKKKNRLRHRKPIEERQGYQGVHLPSMSEHMTRDVADGLVEFFEGLQMADTHEAPSSQVNPEAALEADGSTSNEEIRELEDMGALARDLIRRIQVLRQQFGPNSVAALALPDVRMEAGDAIQQDNELQPEVDDVAPFENPVHHNGVQQDDDDDAEASSSGSGTV